MTNLIKRTISIAAESDYEIHRLAKLWAVPVSQARQRCYHYAAVALAQVTPADLPMKQAADVRQAEAKVEMLRTLAPSHHSA